MTSPILRGLSRRKRCQNLDTTALRVGKQAPQKTPPKPSLFRLVSKTTKRKLMVSGRHIKDNKNGKQVNFSFSNIWWASKVSLLAIRNDCVARSYRFSVPLTCTRAIIRQKVYLGRRGCRSVFTSWEFSAPGIRVLLFVVDSCQKTVICHKSVQSDFWKSFQS